MKTINQLENDLNLSLPELLSAIKAGELIAAVYVECVRKVDVHNQKTLDSNYWDKYLEEVNDYLYIKVDVAREVMKKSSVISSVYFDVNFEKWCLLLDKIYFEISDFRFTEESINRFKEKFKFPKFTQEQLKNIESSLLRLGNTALNQAIASEYFNYWKEHKKKPNSTAVKNKLKKNIESYDFIIDINDNGIKWKTGDSLTKLQTVKTFTNHMAKLNKKLSTMIDESR